MWTYGSAKERLVFVPVSLREEMMDWYHSCLHRHGAERMSLTIRQFFYWYGIKRDIIEFVSKCSTCQSKKITGVKKYSKLPLTTRY